MGNRDNVYSLLTALLVAAVVLTLISPASATFPGKNGKIVFVEAPGPNLFVDVFTVNPDGSDVQQLTFIAANGGSLCCPSWSPDGRQLVFAAEPAGTSTNQLWIMNADGSNQRQLLSDPDGFAQYPSFSPDGTQIVFDRCGAVNCAIYRVQADGTGLTALTPFSPNPDVSDFFPVYSPDGGTIAFTSFARGGVINAVYLMDADGSHVRLLSPPSLEAWIPDWSPDGGRLAFTTHALYPSNTLNQQLWTQEMDKKNEIRQISFPGPAHDFDPSWSPQGNQIVFERDAPDFSTTALYIINVDGTGLRKLHMFSGRAGRSFAPMWPTAGRRGKAAGRQSNQLIQGQVFQPHWGPTPK